MALTQIQLVSAVADRAELSKTDTKRALAALEEVVLEQIGNAQKVRIGGLVQLTVRVKPAQKARKGRNPCNRRGDHDRRQAGEGRPARPPAREGEGIAAIRAEGASPTRGLTEPPAALGE